MAFLPLKWGIHLAEEGKIAHLAQSESVGTSRKSKGRGNELEDTQAQA